MKSKHMRKAKLCTGYWLEQGSVACTGQRPRGRESGAGGGGFPEEERGLLSEPDGGWRLGEAGRGRPTWLIRGVGLGFLGWS